MPIPKALVEGIEGRICGKCKEFKFLADFHNLAKGKYRKSSWCKSCANSNRKANDVKSWWALKVETLRQYGRICFCCGESNVKFLTLDHEWNDKQVQGHITGRPFYHWLRFRGFPKNLGLRVACWNCNSGRAINKGVCPHEEEAQALRPEICLRLIA